MPISAVRWLDGARRRILIKVIGGCKHYPNPPLDIDLQPEIDEDDKATLRRMGAKIAAKTGRNTMAK
jgi:hypothetical protein